MKRIICFLIAAIGSQTIHSQVAEYDTTYRPRTYHLIVDQFKTYPNSEDDVIFLGNSITAYTHWNELLSLPTARNRGISGDTTYGVLERLTEVTEGKPSKVFLLIGINDISRNFPVTAILDNYKKIVQRIQKETPKTELYIQTLLPVNNTFTRYKNHYNKDEFIEAVNKGIKQIALETGVSLIDIHPYFLDENGRLDKKFTEEGLHLNSEGYRNWAKVLLSYVKE